MRGFHFMNFCEENAGIWVCGWWLFVWVEFKYEKWFKLELETEEAWLLGLLYEL
jgi:hypothetical protein